jgi:GTPase SAR1 family protein
MDIDPLSHRVDIYLQWRSDLLRVIGRYRNWCLDTRLLTDELEARLNDAQEIVRRDEIKLAFVGEFSRGKTELINALFFAHSGHRLLPSGAGRTTVCPTELFWDSREKRNYLRLLPIETRMTGSSIANYKKIPDHWVYVPLPGDDPKHLKQAFREVASVKAVTEENASAMGFQVDMLERSEADSSRVCIPAWRHALISYNHPLLRQGLTIIDTPGLNALGCEPEITFNLLPDASAILFLLSAATGVSTTDLDIWNRHIRDLSLHETTGVFAILNKIDSVWDSLESETYNQQTLTRLRNQCARQLSIAPDEIIPVSARQGLLSKIKGNEAALVMSRLPELEKLISNDLTKRKMLVLKNRVLATLTAMLHSSRKHLRRRRDQLLDQKRLFESNLEDSLQQMDALQQQARAEQMFFQKKLIILKSHRNNIERAGQEMLALANESRLDDYRLEAGKALADSWTIVGMNNAIEGFFNHLRQDLEALASQQNAIGQQVAALYAQYEAEQGMAPLEYPHFDARPFLTRLDDLRAKSGSFRRNLKKLLTEQKSTSKRFLMTIATEAASIYRQCQEAATYWLNTALQPLFQGIQEQKQFLDEQVIRLKELEAEGEDAQSKAHHIQRVIETIDSQLLEADEILEALRAPAPLATKQRPKLDIPVLSGGL